MNAGGKRPGSHKPQGFGFVSAAERRAADAFFADLLGRGRQLARRSRAVAWSAGRRSPFVSEESAESYAEQATPVSLAMRGGGIVGNTTQATNVREDVLHALDRLHTLWSITNDDYDREYPRVRALAAGSRVSNPDADLQRTMAAIRKNGEAHLHHAVMRNFFEIDVSAPVGSGQPNRVADVRRLQVILVALKLLVDTALTEGAPSGGAIPAASMPQTLNAIRTVKAGLAGGTLGWDPIHADELESGGDRFGGRTYEWQNLSIFVPHGTSADRNDVHVFFSPGNSQGSSGLNAVLHHGLRAACEGSGWILVGVPGQEPGFVTTTTAQIEGALARVGRSTSIARLRLSAHSRGGRGLRETISGRLVDLAKVDRVVLLDCAFRTVADALTAARIPRSKVIAYQVTDAALPAAVGRNIRIEVGCARAIGYSRLIQDAMQTRPSLVIPADVRRQLLSLPPRGRFRAATATTGSPDNLLDFCRVPANAAQVAAIVRNEAATPNGLKTFVEPPNDLGRLGTRFLAGTYSHHFFVAEIAHEITS